MILLNFNTLLLSCRRLVTFDRLIAAWKRLDISEIDRKIVFEFGHHGQVGLNAKIFGHPEWIQRQRSSPVPLTTVQN